MRREFQTELHQFDTELWPDFEEYLKQEKLEYTLT